MHGVEPVSVASALVEKKSVESHPGLNNLESPRRGLMLLTSQEVSCPILGVVQPRIQHFLLASQKC